MRVFSSLIIGNEFSFVCMCLCLHELACLKSLERMFIKHGLANINSEKDVVAFSIWASRLGGADRLVVFTYNLALATNACSLCYRVWQSKRSRILGAWLLVGLLDDSSD